MKTPLAWRNLTHNRRRLGLSLSGIGFVVLLMFMEIGFLNGSLDALLIEPRSFDADLVMVSSAHTPDYPNRFPRGRLYETRACPAVASVTSLYVRYGATWRIPGTETHSAIRVFGVDSRVRALRVSPPANNAALRKTGTALFDSLSRDLYGRPEPGTRVEVGGRRVEIAGFFEMGVDLATDGNLIMDQGTYFSIFDDSPTLVDFGLIHLHPGSDVNAALGDIRKNLAEDVRIMPVNEYVVSVRRYWVSNTPAAFLFNLGVFVGLVIGVIVCYQVLFTDVSANIKPFATLKAMGYHNRYLVLIVLQQAAILSLLGFACGLAAAVLLYRWLEWSTGLVMYLTALRVLSILCLTVSMCLLAGLLAVRKVIQADPADCF